ncbi:MAG: toprim domain-containing protein [Ignavibacteria bacterium]|nr:toprim domain-containing protein [Ignavibacteria bacterium]
MIDSISPVVDAVESFANIEGHREAISDYGDLRADGLDHLAAARASGYRAIAESRLPEIRGKINRLPTFFREIIQSTYVPDILSAFNVGISHHGATQFWIVDAYGRICNTQEVFYSGLSRNTDRPLRYKFRTGDGYAVSAFFGSEQLQPGYYSWTQRAFDPFAMIVVVESPKSAMLASILYPSVIWLAACGASGITPTKAHSLRGREVRILFDNDQAGTDGARKGLNVLREAGAFAQIVDPTVFFGGSRPNGWDIGDEALMVIGGQA